jgi:hypothetical protein
MVKDLICLQRHIDVVLWETFLEFICRYSQEGASDDDAPNLVSRRVTHSEMEVRHLGAREREICQITEPQGELS